MSMPIISWSAKGVKSPASSMIASTMSFMVDVVIGDGAVAWEGDWRWEIGAVVWDGRCMEMEIMAGALPAREFLTAFMMKTYKKECRKVV